MEVFLNGNFLPAEQALVPVNDRGFMYGDGLFETTRIMRGRPFRLAQHLERLVRGADYLKIPLKYSPKDIQKFVTELVRRNALPEAVLRITLTRGAGDRGYTPSATANPTLVMSLHPLPAMKDDADFRWSMITSSYQVPASGAASSFKTTSKILNVFARLEAQERGADEALLLNTNGEVAETAGGNIFWVYQDKICTVPTGRGVLPGITRAVVLEICQSLGLETSKRVIKPQHLRNAEGIFVTQSVLGVVPVSAFDGEAVRPSPLVDQIASAYDQMLQSESQGD